MRANLHSINNSDWRPNAYKFAIKRVLDFINMEAIIRDRINRKKYYLKNKECENINLNFLIFQFDRNWFKWSWREWVSNVNILDTIMLHFLLYFWFIENYRRKIALIYVRLVTGEIKDWKLDEIRDRNGQFYLKKLWFPFVKMFRGWFYTSMKKAEMTISVHKYHQMGYSQDPIRTTLLSYAYLK